MLLHATVGSHHFVQGETSIVQFKESLLHILVILQGSLQLLLLLDVGLVDGLLVFLHELVFFFQLFYDILTLFV